MPVLYHASSEMGYMLEQHLDPPSPELNYSSSFTELMNVNLKKYFQNAVQYNMSFEDQGQFSTSGLCDG